MQFIFQQNMITTIFPLVLFPTFGQLGRPLPKEPFFTLSNVTVFNMFLCSSCFFKLPLIFSFLFLVWTCNNTEVTLLSDIKQRPVFPDVQNFLPRSFATPHA